MEQSEQVTPVVQGPEPEVPYEYEQVFHMVSVIYQWLDQNQRTHNEIDFLPEPMEVESDKVVIDVWKDLLESKGPLLLEALPTNWICVRTKAPVVYPFAYDKVDARCAGYVNTSMSEIVTMMEKNEVHLSREMALVYLFMKASVLNPNLTAESDKKLTFAFVNKNLLTNSVMPRFFRTKEVFQTYPFDLEKQFKAMEYYPLGTVITLFGSHFYWLLEKNRDLERPQGGSFVNIGTDGEYMRTTGILVKHPCTLLLFEPGLRPMMPGKFKLIDAKNFLKFMFKYGKKQLKTADNRLVQQLKSKLPEGYNLEQTLGVINAVQYVYLK